MSLDIWRETCRNAPPLPIFSSLPIVLRLAESMAIVDADFLSLKCDGLCNGNSIKLYWRVSEDLPMTSRSTLTNESLARKESNRSPRSGDLSSHSSVQCVLTKTKERSTFAILSRYPWCCALNPRIETRMKAALFNPSNASSPNRACDSWVACEEELRDDI